MPGTTPTVRPDRIEFYIDAAFEHRWRYRDGQNGNVLAASGEGYVHRGEALRMAARLFDLDLPTAALVLASGDGEQYVLTHPQGERDIVLRFGAPAVP